MDKTIKNYFTENKFKGDNGQTLPSYTEETIAHESKRTWVF